MSASNEDDRAGSGAGSDEHNRQRKGRRRSLVAFVWYQLLDDDTSGSIARSCDISKDGLGILTPSQVATGSRVFLEISTAHGNISALGTVVFCQETSEGLYRTGIRVDIVPPNDRGLLARVMSDGP